jgi:hypothetical protein
MVEMTDKQLAAMSIISAMVLLLGLAIGLLIDTERGIRQRAKARALRADEARKAEPRNGRDAPNLLSRGARDFGP